MTPLRVSMTGYLVTLILALSAIGSARPALAQALKVRQTDRFYLYYPEDDGQLADRLLAACGPMADFLRLQGLPVPTPLHIVIDEALDEPYVHPAIIPHREIRIPLRAPGVLEDGYTEADPWSYYLFLGLSIQAIYHERSGIPGAAHHLFGEIISPNVILPDWGVDGIALLLYEAYRGERIYQPVAEGIFATVPIPDLDLVSNHPDIWPGRNMYRIFGRNFVRWLRDRYGWEKILAVLKFHGAGIVPFEIDSEARDVFGMDWGQLWRLFQQDRSVEASSSTDNLTITGYWPDPFVYWNDTGIYPGIRVRKNPGRYGYRSPEGAIWFSGYDAAGESKLVQLNKNTLNVLALNHQWDPGPGMVTVTRKGRHPYLRIPFRDQTKTGKAEASGSDLVPAPPDVIQLSGPVMDADGRIAVAANTAGNWDIWLYHNGWYRLTDAPSVELDPWFTAKGLVFASNATGRFQIHSQDMTQLTHVDSQAMLPRGDTYLALTQSGWSVNQLDNPDAIAELALPANTFQPPSPNVVAPLDQGHPYSMWPSIKTNYLIPDVFFDSDNFQFGVATTGRDITGQYTWDAGIRYDSDRQDYSWRLGGQVGGWSMRLAQYAFGYATQRTEGVDEKRWDIKLGWIPDEADFMQFSANYRIFQDNRGSNPIDEEQWLDTGLIYQQGPVRSRVLLEWFTDQSLSLSGDLHYHLHWSSFATDVHFQGGKTWGELVDGHNTFRIGGNSGEGAFTHRSTRLFPVRGFEPNILEAGQALTGSFELQYPLVNLQAGYKTLPLFLGHVTLVGFIDTGFATDRITSDEVLVSIGIEAITGVELAWTLNSDIRIGLAWPVVQPDDLDQEGPTFLIQVGSPI